MKFFISKRNYILIFCFLIPSTLFSQNKVFSYNLEKKDFAILGLGMVSILSANYLERNQNLMTYEELISLGKNEINRLDRSATDNWNTALDKKSEWTRAASISIPSLILIDYAINNQWGNCFTYGTMYLEVGLMTIGITNLSKTLSNRKRPFLYNSNISMSEKGKMISYENVEDSFFSGHTASAFASAVFFSKSYTDIYGKNTLSKIIWGTSLALATTTGYMRYKAGCHYPTDILAGALVGSGIGYLIPLIHKVNDSSENMSCNLLGNSICIAYRF